MACSLLSLANQAMLNEALAWAGQHSFQGGIRVLESGGSPTHYANLLVAALAADRDYTIPDAGAAASFVMTEGAQTINGNKIFGGDITFNGTTTIVNSTNLSVDDRLIRLNDGETGPGITGVYAGFEVYRGPASDLYSLVFDEATDRLYTSYDSLVTKFKVLEDRDIGSTIQGYDAGLANLAALNSGGASYVKENAGVFSAQVGVPYGDLTSFPVALAALGALTPAADQLPYFTGASSAALSTYTAFARSLLDDATSLAARQTLQSFASNITAVSTTPFSPTAATHTGHILLVDSSAAPIEIALPPVAGASGMTLVVVRDGANAVMIEPDGAETFSDGSSSKTISFDGNSVHLYCDGTQWVAFGEIDTSTSFLNLSDTPSSYAGSALKIVQVNAGATALEFGIVLGDMASQQSINVNIVGGAINGTVIGGSAPAAGTFTTLTSTKQVHAVSADLTIASDGITVTGSYHKVNGEGAAADSLSTISGVTNGQLLVLQNPNAYVITLTKVGNITWGVADTTVPLRENDVAVFFYSTANSKWYLVNAASLSDGGGAVPASDVFAGTGAQTVFTLAHWAIGGSIGAYLNGLRCRDISYNASNREVTFGAAPFNGADIEINYWYYLA